MKIKLSRLALASLIAFSSSFPVLANPMADVFDLLDTGGGTRSGTTSRDGYYIVAMGTSSMSNAQKAKEDARLTAMRQLNDMVNGVSISGSSFASFQASTNSAGEEFSSDAFSEVVRTKFNGQLSAAKELKSGTYDGDTYVAIMISQTDVQKAASLRSNVAGGASAGTTQVIVMGNTNQSIADFDNSEQTVESKGMASMRKGESAARQEALKDALRNAVEQTQGVMLQGKAGRFNGAVSLAMSTKTEGYVSRYHIVEEDIVRGEYKVILTATVNSGKLLNDINFYTNILANPVFHIDVDNPERKAWFTAQLESLGFQINDGKTKATHKFTLKQNSIAVEDHKGTKGIETQVSIALTDVETGNILFTINNNPMKARSYIDPTMRAVQVSETMAFKEMQQKMPLEVIQALARFAEKGLDYRIQITNAKRNDIELFKHVLNNGSSGIVTHWDWDQHNKTMTLTYRSTESLSQALDQALNELYSVFKKEGKGRRPTMQSVERNQANFKMIGG